MTVVVLVKEKNDDVGSREASHRGQGGPLLRGISEGINRLR